MVLWAGNGGGSRIFLRGPPTPKVGVLTYYFAFLPKIVWKWKILDPEGSCTFLVVPPWIRQWIISFRHLTTTMRFFCRHVRNSYIGIHATQVRMDPQWRIQNFSDDEASFAKGEETILVTEIVWKWKKIGLMGREGAYSRGLLYQW